MQHFLLVLISLIMIWSNPAIARAKVSRWSPISRRISINGGGKGNTTSGSASFAMENQVQKISEDVVFKGYRDILRREYKLPNGKSATYDILTQRHLSVVVFTWNTTSATTTLIREFHPGSESFMYGTVAGMYESSKHKTPLEASMLELEEEAQLTTDKWIPLLDTMDTSMSFDKYSTNRFYPYLALDCSRVAQPRPMDEDELISVERDVPYQRMMSLLTAGRMNVVSSYAILLGVQKLRNMGIVLEK